MRFSPRTWSLLSVLLFVAAAFFWLKGNEYEDRKRQRQGVPPGSSPTNTTAVDLLSTKNPGMNLAQLGGAQKPALTRDSLYPLRLWNTGRSVNELLRDDRAILLANALIDTAGEPIEIPGHLRAEDDPGTYIVQWTGPTTDAFRELLSNHRAKIVSYVPNNAYLVAVDQADANLLRAAPGVQTVLPFEPYYKLEMGLLALAVEQQPIPEGTLLRLTLVPGTQESALQQIAALNGIPLADENSPFGPQIIIRPAAHTLSSLARLASVQAIEPDLDRHPAADFSRITLGVATNSVASNYFNLTGSNIWVNINDTGIDTNNPGLAGRTFLAPPPPVRTNIYNTDPIGHGTFVAGLIVGNGAQGPSGTNAPSGSDTNASFRGMAPAAKVFAQPIDPAGEELYPKIKDTWLIENAGATNYLGLRRTNSLISNNSWTYGVAVYDSSAARFDAAVRDAVPGATGSQPLLFVFAAGNAGFGDDEGAPGQLGRIESPGTAKNGITVGALEVPRLIQISYTNITFETNFDGTILTNVEVTYPFAGLTDTSNQVASFSSRGNIGIGIEGDFGRFKPDVVAPGAMLVSLRSRGWNVANSVDTNTSYGGAFAALQTNLTPYRYDSGTTFAAANVSGMLALIQEYFESQAPNGARSASMSPALMKAMLLNGTRSLTEFYDFALQSSANSQGWGLPSLPNSLTSYSTNSQASLDDTKWRLRYAEQSPANALTTGQSRTWKVTLTTNASVFPFRMTLVWTDPPGNPSVGVKLVNDLDLIVTNTETEAVFYGNNFLANSSFTSASDGRVGEVGPIDSVNNVENVFIRNPSQFGREFTVTVRARRVNVNAVNNFLAATATNSAPAQDFALVISSDMGSDPSLDDEETYFAEEDLFEEFTAPTVSVQEGRPPLTVITNGLPLLTERVGANPTLIGQNVTNGSAAQWNFYVFTNLNFTNAFVTTRAGSNVAFVTFNPPNLSRPRDLEADIDVYVSTDPNLTNLNPTVLRNAASSKERGGSETVVFTNAALGNVYYVGVKSEDQQGAEFSLVGISTDGPFEEEENGRIILHAVPITSVLLDGSPNRPVASTLVAIGVSGRRVARTIVTNVITHENLGDLFGVLSHAGVHVVLNNHTLNNGNFSGTNIVLSYDDYSWETPGPNSTTRPSDGPGSLTDFSGRKISGSWIMEIIDNAAGHTGRVESSTIAIDPLQDNLVSGVFASGSVDGGRILFYPIDVTPGATNMTVTFSQMPAGRILEVFLRREAIPQTNIYDFRTNIVGPGGVFTFPTASSDPLSPGTYFLGVRNPVPGSLPIAFRVLVQLAFDNSGSNRFSFDGGAISVPDDATSRQVIQVDDDKLVASVSVGVQMGHPRASDTVLSLLSPQGTRVLLAENRGFTNTLGFGGRVTTTNSTSQFYTVFTDDTNLARLPIKFVDLSAPVGGKGHTAITSGFEGLTNGNYNPGNGLAGWTVFSSNSPPQNTVSIISGANYAHSGTNLLSLGRGIIRTNVTLTNNQTYKLSFAVRAAPLMMLFNTGTDDQRRVMTNGSLDPHYQVLNEAVGPNVIVTLPRPGFSANNLTSAWVRPFVPTPPPPGIRFGTYRYRTYINMYEQNTVTLLPRLRWSASDDLVADVYLNGLIQNIPPGPANAFNTSAFGALGGLRPGLNIVDFVVEDLLASIRVEAATNSTVAAKVPPSLTVEIGGVRRQISGLDDWSMTSFDFVPTNTASYRISFESGAGEIWVDSIALASSSDVFALPEEPLDNLQGERSIGEWALEVKDAQTGAVLPPTDVLSWKLDLVYAQPSLLAERLVAGNNFPLTPPQINPTNRMRGGVLFTNQTHYFAIYPCDNARQITVTLSGVNNFDAVEMLVDHSGIPTGLEDRDDFVPLRNNENPGSPGGRAVFRLSVLEPAPAAMVPGKPFFVALRNRFINTTNVYLLRVDSDALCSLVLPTALSPNTTIQSVLATTAEGEATEGDTFSATVAANASSVSFKVEAEGDVMIVAQKGSIPTRESYSHIQNTPGSGNEELRITSSSSVPLTSGQWFVRVFNNSTETVAYNITGSGDLTDPVDSTYLAAAMSDGFVQLSWNSTPGVVYAVEASTDLENWLPIANVTAEGNSASYSEPATAAGWRCYRVVRQP